MKLGMLLNEEYTEKLQALADYNESTPYNIILDAIDTMVTVLELDA